MYLNCAMSTPFFHFLHEALDFVKRLPAGDIIHTHDNASGPVVIAGDDPEPWVACEVPQVNANQVAGDADAKVDANGGQVGLWDWVTQEGGEKTGLASAGVAN